MKIAALFFLTAITFFFEGSGFAQNPGPGNFTSITVSAGATIVGDAEMRNNVYFTDAATVFTVAGATSFWNSVTASSDVSFSGANKQFTVAGTSTFSGNTTAAGDVTFSGSAKQFTVANTSTFNGASTFNSPFLATGILRATGAYNSGDTIPAASTNSTLLWYPRKAAFRAGIFTDGRWSDLHVGEKSVAFGSNSMASGAASTALSGSTAEGIGSFAGGVGWAKGDAAFAYGRETKAFGDSSIAIGKGVEATTLSTIAVGQYSIDRKTTPTTGATTWLLADPLFVVGNGTSNTTRSNALVVYKNGTVEIGDHLVVNADGSIIMSQPQGDISMGQYGN